MEQVKTDWEKRARELIESLGQGMDEFREALARAALQLGREMVAESLKTSERCADEPEKPSQSWGAWMYEGLKHLPDGTVLCGGDVLNEVVRKAREQVPEKPPLGRTIWPNDAECDRNGWARGSRIELPADGFTIYSPAPKTREQVLKEALREIRDHFDADDRFHDIARRALEVAARIPIWWKP